MLHCIELYSQELIITHKFATLNMRHKHVIRPVIQMMHGSEWSQWTLKYDEPEVENVARGRLPCFKCFVVWPTTSLKLYIVY